MVTPNSNLVAEYENLIVQRAKASDQAEESARQFAKQLAEMDGRLAELRATLFGHPITTTTATTPKSVYAHMKENASATATTAVEQASPAIASVVIAIKKLGGKAKNQAVAEELGITSGAAAIRLSIAARDGWIRRVAHGEYEAS
jgi:hypothetical protein